MPVDEKVAKEVAAVLSRLTAKVVAEEEKEQRLRLKRARQEASQAAREQAKRAKQEERLQPDAETHTAYVWPGAALTLLQPATLLELLRHVDASPTVRYSGYF